MSSFNGNFYMLSLKFNQDLKKQLTKQLLFYIINIEKGKTSNGYAKDSLFSKITRL